jgi:serine/threonine protein phosphatase PrpC
MASLTTLTKHTSITMTSAVKQATSKQDFVFHGSSSDKAFDYLGAADAHGKVLNALYPTTILKNMDFSNDLKNPEYFEKIMKKTNVQASNGVGSTLCICKIFEDRFEFSWVGDSTGKIYKEGECIWQTKDHDRNNTEELERIKNSKEGLFITEKDKRGNQILDIQVKNPTTIEMIKAKLFHFGNMNKINFTHSLGHAGLTGSHISKEIIPREPDVSYKVICATDGLWAIVCDEDHEFLGKTDVNSKDIVEFADNRWRQQWKQEFNGNIVGNSRFPEYNIDDIGVATWSC